MKFVVLSLIINSPDPHTGQTLSQHDKLRSVLAQAELTVQVVTVGQFPGGPSMTGPRAESVARVRASHSNARPKNTLSRPARATTRACSTAASTLGDPLR